jgi:hypothetical protein
MILSVLAPATDLDIRDENLACHPHGPHGPGWGHMKGKAPGGNDGFPGASELSTRSGIAPSQ